MALSKEYRAQCVRAGDTGLYLATAIRVDLFGSQGALDVVHRMRYGYRAA